MFRRHQRQNRDREHGLVFRWRGARSHHLGKFLALAAGCSLFGFALYAVKLEEVKTPVVSQRTASIIYLDETSPDCQALLMEVWDKSPFPPRWDPARDTATLQRVFSKSHTFELPASRYEPTLAPYPSQTEDGRLPAAIDPNTALLPERSSFWNSISDDRELSLDKPSLSLILSPGPSLTPRLLHNELPPPTELIPDEWYGQSFRFLLTVDAAGRVSSGYALPGGTLDEGQQSEAQKQLLTWLKTQQFKPSTRQRSSTGRLEISIRATRP